MEKIINFLQYLLIMPTVNSPVKILVVYSLYI
jgi:hypothetical protein